LANGLRGPCEEVSANGNEPLAGIVVVGGARRAYTVSVRVEGSSEPIRLRLGERDMDRGDGDRLISVVLDGEVVSLSASGGRGERVRVVGVLARE